MDISSILKENEGDLLSLFKDKLKLDSSEVEKSIEGVQEGLGNVLIEESTTKGLGTLLNLFSENKNSGASNSLINSLTKKVINSLLSKGFGGTKAKAISAIAVPFVVNLISSKVGGQKNILGELLNVNSSKQSPVKGLLDNFF